MNKINEWVFKKYKLKEQDFKEMEVVDTFRNSKMWNQLREGGVMGYGTQKFYEKRIQSIK